MTSPYFCIFVIFSPLKRTWPFNWTNLNSFHPCIIWPSLIEIGLLVLEKKIFKIKIFFLLFVIISPCRRLFSFIWTNLNPLSPRTTYAKSGWNWPRGDCRGLKMWKLTDNVRTMHVQWTIRKTHLSFQLRWAKNEIIQGLAQPFLGEVGIGLGICQII
jgi:hypothetical protein